MGYYISLYFIHQKLKIVFIQVNCMYITLLVPDLVQEAVRVMPYQMEWLPLSYYHGQLCQRTSSNSSVWRQLLTFFKNANDNVHINILITRLHPTEVITKFLTTGTCVLEMFISVLPNKFSKNTLHGVLWRARLEEVLWHLISLNFIFI